jgi:hypothetical protein
MLHCTQWGWQLACLALQLARVDAVRVHLRLPGSFQKASLHSYLPEMQYNDGLVCL